MPNCNTNTLEKILYQYLQKKQWIFNPQHKNFNQVNTLTWEEHQEGLN